VDSEQQVVIKDLSLSLHGTVLPEPRGNIFKAHGLLYHSTLGWSVIKKTKKEHLKKHIRTENGSSQGQNLALTVVYVPCSLGGGTALHRAGREGCHQVLLNLTSRARNLLNGLVTCWFSSRARNLLHRAVLPRLHDA